MYGDLRDHVAGAGTTLARGFLLYPIMNRGIEEQTMTSLSKSVLFYIFRAKVLPLMVLWASIWFPCFCSAQETQSDAELGKERNVPVRLSLKLIDQFGENAPGVSCYVRWIPGRWWRIPGYGSEDTYSEKDKKEERLESSPDGKVIFQSENHRAPSVGLGIDDKRYMKAYFKFPLIKYFLDKYMDPKRDVIHSFDENNPVIISVWRRIGYKPLISYSDRNNEIDLTSARGELRLDLRTFQPMENGGDIVISWAIGDTVPPQEMAWMMQPQAWPRELRYTISVTDGNVWTVADENQWLVTHGVIPDHMPHGKPTLERTASVTVNRSETHRFLVVSRNGHLCAKLSMATTLRDPLRGVVRLNFGNTLVNPAGPPSLEVQPGVERDYAEGNARQQITLLNEKLRSFGSGQPPSPLPTEDFAWSTYERVCRERGLKPDARPTPRQPDHVK